MDTTSLQHVFLSLMLSGILGGLIGMDKDIWKHTDSLWQKDTDTDLQFWSIRTFSLIAIFWALMTWIDTLFDSGYTFVIMGLVLTAVLVGIYYLYSVFKKIDISPATEFVAFLTYFVWVAVFLWHSTLAIIFSIILTFFISSKNLLEWVGKYVSKDELRTTLKFLVIAFVILPLLPNQSYSLWDIIHFLTGVTIDSPLTDFDFFNPYSIWLFVVIMSGVSYLGYILTKFVEKDSSIIISSVLGGMVSSTATTASMTQKSSEDPANTNSYVIGTLIASCIMFLRVFAIVLFFNWALFQVFLFPAWVMFLGLLAPTVFFYFAAKREDSTPSTSVENDVRSPFQIAPALKFASFIVMIKYISWVGIVYKDVWGEQVFYSALGILSWLADVDAITQTMAVDSQKWLISLFVAATTILLAVMSNNFIKWTIAWKFWNPSFQKKVMGSFVFSIFLGALAIWFNISISN